ncbi:hypothetical protein MMC28_004313 [Mycoblastus sanguinarius]|nr:hypothetical protein [Mycoblastus sanguinarius]
MSLFSVRLMAPKNLEFKCGKWTESKLVNASKLTLATFPAFLASSSKVIKDHPDVDCVINNAGVVDVNYFDLQKVDQEIDINIRGPMHLAIGFLDQFKSKPNGVVIINVSSVLGYTTASVISPVYNGTKAWSHF